MGISRKAFWNDLMNARKKIAAALVYGMGIRIEGGSYVLRGGNDSKDMEEQTHQHDIEIMEQELALTRSRVERLGSKLAGLKEMDKTDKDERDID